MYAVSRDIIVSLALVQVVVTAESVGLRNIAVINGSTASFSCIIHSPEPEVCWTHETISLKNYNHLYREGNLTFACDNNKCDVTFDNETDRYTLTITSVQHYDAGFYECGECYGSVSHSAHLIVIQPADMTEKTAQFCWMNFTSSDLPLVADTDYLTVSCRISYLAPSKWIPYVQCLPNIVGLTEVSNRTSEEITYVKLFKATPDLNGISCTAKFNSPGYEPDSTDNTPADVILWKTASLKIQYGPRLVGISPRSPRRIAQGHVMVCTSEGNPHPTFHWTAWVLEFANNNTTFTGAELAVDVCNLTAWNQRSEKKNVSGTTRVMLICHAENTVRGQLRSASAHEIYNLALLANMDEVCGDVGQVAPSGKMRLTYVTVGFAVLFAVVCIIIIIVCSVQQRLNRPSGGRNGTQLAQHGRWNMIYGVSPQQRNPPQQRWSFRSLLYTKVIPRSQRSANVSRDNVAAHAQPAPRQNFRRPTGRDYEDLPETSNPEYSDVNVPNITVNLNDSYNARGNGANDVDQNGEYSEIRVCGLLPRDQRPTSDRSENAYVDIDSYLA